MAFALPLIDAFMLALAGSICFASGPARAQGGCSAPAEAAGLEHAPQHIRDRVARKLPIKIVNLNFEQLSPIFSSAVRASVIN